MSEVDLNADDLNADDLNAALDVIEARAEVATQGPWAVHNMADDEYDSTNHAGWWWVWRAGVGHYAGVMEMDQHINWGDGVELPSDRQIGVAQITDNDDGEQERRDAEFIAHARTDVPTLARALRKATERADRAEAALARVARILQRPVNCDYCATHHDDPPPARCTHLGVAFAALSGEVEKP